jgi:ornithine cyclodeaminase/alanine dehydrogenase
MGAKVFGVGRQPAVNYLIALFEQSSGELRALVDGANITSYRTACTSAAAMEALTGNEEIVLAIVGSGQEAHAHAHAIHAIRKIRELRVFSPSADKRAAFAKKFAAECGVPSIAADTAEDAVRPATVVVAAARSRDETPTVYGAWLENCKAIVSVGSTLPEQREIDASVVERSDLIICDVLEEVIDGTGDMIAARTAGVRFKDKSFSLNDLLTGALAGRVKAAKLPMFKSVGAGIQDIVVAELAYNLARDAGRLTSLPIEFYTKA